MFFLTVSDREPATSVTVVAVFKVVAGSHGKTCGLSFGARDVLGYGLRTGLTSEGITEIY